VTIIKSGESKSGYSIPKPGFRNKDNLLDDSIILKTLKETEQVQSILAEVFTNEAQQLVESIPERDEVMGLDQSHSNLVKLLLEKSKWTKNEFESLCDNCGILPGGAIETINDNSYKKFNEGLIEEGDLIEINIDLMKEVKA
jgi:hypothetical protein